MTLHRLATSFGEAEAGAGLQDYAVRCLAHTSCAFSVHRISPHVRNDREMPLNWVRRRSYADDLFSKLSGIFLSEGLNSFLVICPSCQFVAGRCTKSRLRA
jgi:hypothetical protein